MNLGLRIDVDTLRGTRYGVPVLNSLLQQYGIQASYFFCVGPDNMGRHLWRLLRPDFLAKMLRTKAASLYGWDILFRGTFWPGPKIGRRCSEIIQATAAAGHEIGLHAWDHHLWQAKIDKLTSTAIGYELWRGFDALTEMIGQVPVCSAVPGWRCTNLALLEKEKLPFRFNSDCRGTDVFWPVANAQKLNIPQIPVTLPTYDEIIGRDGVSDSNYNDYVLGQLRPDGLNVLTIHAEVEGIGKRDLFAAFLARARVLGVKIVPLGSFLEPAMPRHYASVVMHSFPGREGWLALQGPVI